MQGASTALRTSERLSRAWIFAERSANEVAKVLDRWKYLLLVACTAFYTFITCYQANRKLFWFDEIFTIYVSRLQNLRLIWDSLIDGADYNPILLYVLTHFSEAILGQGHLRARLPAIIGFWIFCLCLFRFVSIRSSGLAGFISMSFPLTTTAYLYAFEARAYGTVLGFVGLALISWQALATAKKGRFGLALALFASLVGALLTHAYAFLVFVPFVAGELARSIFRRSVDWIVWLALVASGLAMLASLPAFLALRSLLGVGEFFVPSVEMLVQTYDSLLGPAATLTTFVLGLICLDFLRRQRAMAGQPDRASKQDGIQEPRFQPHERIALVGFLTIPFFSYLAARLSGAPMMDRYSLATVAGIAALMGMAAGKRAATGLLVLTVLSALFARQFMDFIYNIELKEPSSGLKNRTLISTSQPDFRFRYYRMSLEDKNLPIVLLDPMDFPVTFLYAPAEILPRLVYLREGRDIFAESYENLQKCCSAVGRVETLDELLATTNTFLAYSPTPSFGVVNRFAENGGTISVKTINTDYALFQVTYPSR
jgi:hypothetical protein